MSRQTKYLNKIDFIKKNKRVSSLVAVVIVLAVTLFLVHINTNSHSPKSFVGATGTDSLSLTPASGTYNVGSTITVTVNETTSSDAVNAVEADLTYNDTQLQYVSSSATCDPSTFSLVGQETGGSGTVNLDCAVPSNTETGTVEVGTVQFTVLAGGSSSISFASTCQIVLASNYSNTWNGVTTGGTYTLANAPTVSVTNVTANSEIYGSAFAVDSTDTPYSGGSISSVQLLLNGTAVQTLTSSPYNFSLNTLTHADGSYTISIKATDNESNTATTTVTAYISNGDLNGSGSVGLPDLAILAGNWGKTGQTYAEGNITGQSTVNISDLSVLATNWGWAD